MPPKPIDTKWQKMAVFLGFLRVVGEYVYLSPPYRGEIYITHHPTKMSVSASFPKTG